jgi:putative transcriptional regulator
MNNCIKELRKSNSVTQVKMANKIGISRGGLQNIEKGLSMPTVDTAFKIARYFNKRIDEVFELC